MSLLIDLDRLAGQQPFVCFCGMFSFYTSCWAESLFYFWASRSRNCVLGRLSAIRSGRPLLVRKVGGFERHLQKLVETNRWKDVERKEWMEE